MIELDEANTGFGYMMQAYKMGGPYMHWITIFGLLALGVAIWKIVEILGKEKANTKLLELIRMSGSLALAIGFMSKIVGIVQALEAIRAAADVSPQIVMGGAIVSFYAPIWGFIVFNVAMLLYYVLKEVIKHKTPANN
jgi:biopolymer transport protein ExbB/TolQ